MSHPRVIMLVRGCTVLIGNMAAIMMPIMGLDAQHSHRPTQDEHDARAQRHVPSHDTQFPAKDPKHDSIQGLICRIKDLAHS